MPSYGVRFYKVELFNGAKRKPLTFQSEDDGTQRRYRDHLHQVIDAYKARQVRGLPLTEPDGLTADEIRQRPAVVFEKADIKGDALITEFRIGRSEDFDRAYPAPDMDTQDFIPLAGYAPARPYRAVLMVPHTGEVALLAVETIGRMCPYMYFVRWATQWSRDYQGRLDEEKPLADDKVRPWWRLKATKLGSREQLMQFLNHGTVEEMVLVNNYIDKARDEKQERFRVTARLHGPRVWERRKIQDVFEVDSDQDFAHKLAHDFGHDMDQLEIDDGWIVVQTDAGTKNISPSRLPEVFTYPVSDQRPTMTEFLTAVKMQAIPLAKAIDAKIDFSSW